jgi:hypothetical protein
VRQVLDYTVTEIPPEKIFMGMPNSGYVGGNGHAALILYGVLDIRKAGNSLL